MDTMVAGAAAVVWLVFLMAGLRKLREGAATVKSLRGFGLPDGAAAALAPALPWMELAVAGLLLVPGFAVLGAGLALVLLVVFTTVVVSALLRNKRPACNCFGQAADRPISWWTAARNGLLLALAAAVAARASLLNDGAFSLWAETLRPLDATALALVALGVLVLAQFMVMAKLFSQQGRMLLRIDNLEHDGAQRGSHAVTQTLTASGPPMGALAPDFDLMPLVGGAAQRMANRLAVRPELVLVFISPDCAPCHELLDWLRHQPERGLAVVVTSGSPEHNRRLRAGHDGLDIVIQSGQEAQDRYGVIGTPSAVRIRDGRIASPMAIGLGPIQSLFAPDKVAAVHPPLTGAVAQGA